MSTSKLTKMLNTHLRRNQKRITNKNCNRQNITENCETHTSKSKTHDDPPINSIKQRRDKTEINEKLMQIHTRIINGDYDHLEENLLIMQLSSHGCDICMHIIISEKSIPYPHLIQTGRKKAYIPKGVYFCPNILLRNLKEKKSLLSEKKICKRCLKTADEYCHCPSYQDKKNRNYFCRNCNCHNIIGDCNTCTYKSENKKKRYINLYNKITQINKHNKLPIENNLTNSYPIDEKAIQKTNEAITSKNITNHDEDNKKNRKETPRKPVENDSKTPNKKKESKKPEVVIVSFIEGNTANKITKLQDKLIKRGVNGYLKVKEAKIHITHIALYTAENLERIFYATTK